MEENAVKMLKLALRVALREHDLIIEDHGDTVSISGPRQDVQRLREWIAAAMEAGVMEKDDEMTAMLLAISSALGEDRQ